jgi:hypothetical protein
VRLTGAKCNRSLLFRQRTFQTLPGTSIVPELFGFVKKNLSEGVRSAAEVGRR